MLWLEIPAYAGSTSPAPAGQGPAPDHPRIRGEHRSTAGTTASRRGSSPHTRGALGILLAIFIQLGIIPAYAGSTQAPARIPHLVQDHPRIRGEHVPAVLPCCCGAGSSPHTRGAHVGDAGMIAIVGIIPAYAGSTSRRYSPAAAARDHPRIRGEHRMAETPHQAPPRIIPAYAGSTTLVVSRDHLMPDHPRIRGEHCVCKKEDFGPIVDHPRIRGEHIDLRAAEDTSKGSSPHTRGARTPKNSSAPPGRIIPAYAGSTGAPLCRGPGRRDHPRIRGEHALALRDQVRAGGSSPHTRGAPPQLVDKPPRTRIIPAYAGSTRYSCRAAVRRRDHPRIRGEHPASYRPNRPPLGSSPHTRGAPRHRPRTSSGRADHPRIRGEHISDGSTARMSGGSSPHTRGALLCETSFLYIQRIIPAYAGSTS